MPPLPPDINAPPCWAHWIAQDADGSWWAYEVEPLQHDHGWYENELGRNQLLGKGAANPRWAHSLQGLHQIVE